MPRRAAVQDRFKTPEELEQEADELLGVRPAPKPNDPPDDKIDEPEPKAPSPDSPDDKAPKPAAAPKNDSPHTLADSAQRLSDAQRKMHDAIAESNRLREQNANMATQMATLTTEMQALRQQVTALSSKPAPGNPDSPSPESMYADIEALAGDYPNIVRPFLATFKTLNKQLDTLRTTMATMQTDTEQRFRATQEQTEQSAFDAYMAPIRRAHKDADSLPSLPAFQAWIQTRPTADYFAIYGDPNNGGAGGDAETVIAILDAYKKSIGKERLVDEAEQASTPRLRGSERPPAKPSKGKAFTRAEIAAMTPQEFAKNEAEIDRQMAEGLITS